MTKKTKSQSIKLNRGTVDKVVSMTGAVLAVGLIFVASALFWAHDFIHGQVVEQLSAQKITFAAADSASFKALDAADQAAIKPYAGQALTTGAQAEVFANHYIAAHLRNSGGGKTYSELSEESRANPTDTALKAKVDTMFRGETLRGVLLNAYAFDTMAIVAKVIAVGALFVSALLAILAILGFNHARKSR